MRKLTERMKKIVSKEDGVAEILQTLMLAGAGIALVLLVFYPQTSQFFGTAMDSIGDWFTGQVANTFI